MNSLLNPVFLATVISTVASIFTIMYLVRVLVRKRPAHKFASWVIPFIAVIAYPFSWFLGYVIGGNFGGSIAGLIPVHEPVLIAAGIGVGIFICTTAVAGLIVGCCFLFTRILSK